MKELDIPKSGKRGNTVVFRSRYGQCARQHVKPVNRRTFAQCQWRKYMGDVSTAWGDLTDERRVAWTAAGAMVRRRDTLGRVYSLAGQAHFVGINSARVRVGREILLDPPQPVDFGPNPVEKLFIEVEGGRVTLKLSVGGPVTADIMIFGAAPCSPGRMKCRNVTYLGLLPAPVGGLSDITRLYYDVYGAPPVGWRVFIRTQQQVKGWESGATDTSAVVRAKPVPGARRRGR